MPTSHRRPRIFTLADHRALPPYLMRSPRSQLPHPRLCLSRRIYLCLPPMRSWPRRPHSPSLSMDPISCTACTSSQCHRRSSLWPRCVGALRRPLRPPSQLPRCLLVLSVVVSVRPQPLFPSVLQAHRSCRRQQPPFPSARHAHRSRRRPQHRIGTDRHRVLRPSWPP